MKFAVFALCSAVGFLAGHFLPPGPLAVYAPLLVSYHLFLAYLVITAEREAGLALPVFSTLVTHLACLALLVGIAMGRTYVPFFGLIRYLIPGLAPFEADWLFSSGPKREKVEPAAATHGPELSNNEYEAFLKYLAQPERQFLKPGMSLSEERAQWRAARAKTRA